MGFQSGIDLDIQENSRKKDPSFKFRKIIILPRTRTKTQNSIARKANFSSAMEGGAAKEFQPHPCKISYLFCIKKPTFCTQLVLLPARLAAADSKAVLQDGKRPAANSCVSSETGMVGLLIKAYRLPQGKDKSSSRLSRLCGSQCQQSHCYEGNAFIQFLPARSVVNLGMHLAMSCLSTIPITATCAHMSERREKKEHHLLTCWLRKAPREPPFSAQK